MPAKLPSRCSSFPSGFEKVVAVGNGAVNIGQSSHKLLRQATFTTTNASECSSRVSSNAVEGAIICAYPLNDSAVFTDDAGRVTILFLKLLAFCSNYGLEALPGFSRINLILVNLMFCWRWSIASRRKWSFNWNYQFCSYWWASEEARKLPNIYLHSILFQLDRPSVKVTSTTMQRATSNW